MVSKKTNIGKAYGFIGCSAPIGDIERNMSGVRGEIGTPKELELSLMEGVSGLKGLEGNPGLKRFTELATRANLRYTVEAKYPGADNEKTANELADVINHTSTSLFRDTPENIRAEIVYEENGKYIRKD